MRLQEARARIMRLSRYLLPTRKETPAEAQIVSHRYMLRAGMIRQTSAGFFAWLPLGFRVLKKFERIVREEQDRFGVQELLMPTLHPAALCRVIVPFASYGLAILRTTYSPQRAITLRTSPQTITQR